MKKLILQLCMLSTSAQAAPIPFTGLYDLAISKGTGVDRVQFVLGGEKESINGTTDTEAVRKLFKANVIGFYRCYAATYGAESATTGDMLLHLELTAEGIKKFSLDSKTLNTPGFADCLKLSVSKLKLEAFPADAKTISISMPVQAVPRSRQ